MALVTPAEVRALIPGIDAADSSDDTTFLALIAAVEGVFARICGYPPPSPGQRPTLESRPYVRDYTGEGGLCLDLAVYPVASITSVTQDPLADWTTSTTVASTEYAVIDGRELRLKSTSSAAWFTEPESNRVAFVAGYGASTKLNVLLTDSATTITVASTAGFTKNRSGGGRLLMDEEVILFSGTTATTFTGCTRGAEGTGQAEHVVGTTIYEPVPDDLKQLIAETVAWRYTRRGNHATSSRTSGQTTEAYGQELPSSVMAALGPYMLPRAVC